MTIPEGEAREKTRISLAFFLLPDDDFMVTCMDGSNKYEPMAAKDLHNSNISARHTHMPESSKTEADTKETYYY